METKSPFSNPEIWGGLECTINRIGQQYTDQLNYSGHYIRSGDLEQFAKLGIKKIRYPILWERHQPDPHRPINWEWITRQLEELRRLNVTPIAGLVHHGSGPMHTDLLDPEFAVKLSSYALQVAKQFPWLLYYTPVNEPLTTARFSGLYGLWYPHRTDEASFLRMLVNQCKAIVLSMNAIRSVNPFAKLVQTEDLGKTHATPLLAYQATFENNRRWLTWDLLCGKVNKQHLFWDVFKRAGIAEDELTFLSEHPCPPDLIGCNYYVTSERWLDEDLSSYRPSERGGNGIHQYADTPAVRKGRTDGLEHLLLETWERYKLPIAITECHIDCTREEQLRWLMETWQTSTRLRRQGVPIRAVTAWALMGARDWDSLLTKENNHYETGIFDVSLGNLRPTALAQMVQSFAASGDYCHPLLDAKGWWHEPGGRMGQNKVPILISGPQGDMLQVFQKACQQRALRNFYIENGAVEHVNAGSCWAYVTITGDELKCSGDLTIVHDNVNLERVAETALNLLIDSESGTWYISPQGIIKKIENIVTFA